MTAVYTPSIDGRCLVARKCSRLIRRMMSSPYPAEAKGDGDGLSGRGERKQQGQ